MDVEFAMLRNKKPIEEIIKYTCLNKDQIQKLAEEF